MALQFIIDSSTLSGVNSANFEYQVSQVGIDVSDPEGKRSSRMEISLGESNIWYSYPNLSPDFDNQTFKYRPGATASWETLTIPEGVYNIEDIDAYIKQEMKTNGDYGGTDSNGDDVYYFSLTADNNQLKAVITLSNSYQVDLTAGNLYLLLGFDSQVLNTDGKHVAENRANIENGVSNILIHCSLVGNSPYSGSYVNGNPSDVLYSFNPNVPPGNLITITPNPPIWLPVKESLITTIRMRVTDQAGNLLNLRGENTSYRLVLRERPT